MERDVVTYDTRAPVPDVRVAPDAQVELEGPVGCVQCRPAGCVSTTRRCKLPQDTHVMRR